MPRFLPPLSDRLIAQVPPGKQRGDGRIPGLLIENPKSGAKRWRYKFQKPDGKWTLRALGQYPEVSLDAARDLATQMQAELIQGNVPKTMFDSPIPKPKAKGELHKFEEVAEEWLEFKTFSKSANNLRVMASRIKHANNVWYDRPIASIEGLEALDMLRELAKRAPETAIRLRNILSDIWEFAILKGYVKDNVMRHFKGVDIGRSVKKHYEAITEPKDFRLLLRAIDGLTVWPLTRLALLIDAHVFIRSTELRLSKWAYVDFEKKLWIIPGESMKTKKDHIIPLSTQVIGYLEEAKRYQKGEFIFFSPNDSSKPLSNNVLNMTMERLGFDGVNFPRHVLHGFRASFRTIADEELRQPIDCIEFQLAHEVKDALGTAYNRTKKIEDRTVMMQTWSDYLENLMKD